MFVNCPHCRTLVATDPATDLPPRFCPECASPLREVAGDAASDADSGRGARDAARPGLDADTAAQPVDTASTAHRDSWWDEIASRARSDDAPGAGEAASDTAVPASTTEAEDPATSAQVQPATDSATAEPAPAASAAALAAARVTPLRSSVPGFLRRREGAPARRDWRMPAAIAGLGLLLALQVLLADRERLAGQAGWRPLLATLCAGLGCTLPPWREPGAFTLLQRDVRQHPTRPGALRVSATFRNDARWPQPWPRLQLSLADVHGRTAGVRSFTAEEYLGGAPAQPELASGETATVAMDILEPAPDIVAFDFGFR